MSEFVVITGPLGGGRSQAADHLEDLGWFVIDNLPAALDPEGGRAGRPTRAARHDRVALVVRSGDYEEEIRPALDALRPTAQRVRILFLDASTDVLVRRYEGTPPPPPARRREPGRRASSASGRCSNR